MGIQIWQILPRNKNECAYPKKSSPIQIQNLLFFHLFGSEVPCYLSKLTAFMSHFSHCSAIDSLRKVLVTGGAGFIGSHLVDRLMDSGLHVVVLDDFSRGSIENLGKWAAHPRMHLLRQDINGSWDDSPLVEEVDAVVHLAAIGRVRFSTQYPELCHRVNVDGTQRVLEWASTQGIKRFVFASSSSVYGHAKALLMREDHSPLPMSPYALQKLEAERAVLKAYSRHGLPALVLRIFTAFGERQSLHGSHLQFAPATLRALRQGRRPEIFGDGRQSRDFTYVGDVVEGLWKALGCREDCLGQVFNIGSGRARSIVEIAEMIEETWGKRIDWKWEKAIEEPKFTLACTKKAVEMLGFKARADFKTALATTVAHFSSLEEQPV